MAWIKVESSVARNRKFVKAGPGPSWLWICGLAYSQEGLTDGFIPAEAINFLGVRSARTMVKHLVSAGLWDVVEGGWQVHDYLGHNKPADEVRRIQQERRAAGSLGGSIQAKNREALKQTVKDSLNPATAVATASATDKRSDGTARARASLHDTSHKKHVHCGRICVHSSQHDAFVRRRNTPNADKELQAFYMEIEHQWSAPPLDTQEPGDPFDFWRARYAERWPTAVKTQARRPAEQPPKFTEWTCPHVEEHVSKFYCDQATALNRPRKMAMAGKRE